MAKFCGKCGTVLDSNTGFCPSCDSEKFEAPVSKKEKSKALTTTITVLLSICLFFTLLISTTIFTLRSAISGDNAEELIDSINAADLLDSLEPVSNGKIEYFFEVLEEDYGIVSSDRKLNNFVEDSTVKDFLSEKIEDFSDDFSEGNAEIIITKRELWKLITENKEVIENEFNVKLTYEDLREISDLIFEGRKWVIISMPELKENNPAIYYALTIGLSYVTMVVFMLLSALIIWVMVKNDLSQALCGVGINFIIWGIITCLIALLASVLLPLWSAITFNSYIGILLGSIISVNSVLSIFMLVTGVLLIVGKVVLKRFLKKNV